MLVGRGKDTALVEIDHLFAVVPTVDVTQVGGAIAAKIRSGPPSPEETIATAGLITLADLPIGWEQESKRSASTAGSEPDDQDDSVPDREEEVIAAAKHVPACNAFAPLLDTGRSTGGAPRLRLEHRSSGHTVAGRRPLPARTRLCDKRGLGVPHSGRRRRLVQTGPGPFGRSVPEQALSGGRHDRTAVRWSVTPRRASVKA